LPFVTPRHAICYFSPVDDWGTFSAGDKVVLRQKRQPINDKRTLRRRAVIIVELLLMLPILLLLLVAITEFGMIFAVTQKVAFASRHGAKLTAEQGTPTGAILFVTNGNMRVAVNQQLANAGLQQGACRVTLEHNGPASPAVVSDAPVNGACDCQPPGGPLPTPATALRVTVCVPLEGNVPDLLSTFGFSLAGRYVQESTTVRLE